MGQDAHGELDVRPRPEAAFFPLGLLKKYSRHLKLGWADVEG